MAKPRLDDIEDAIIAAINADATLSAYIKSNQVQALGERGVDFARQQIVVAPPAILLFYTGGSHRARNINLTGYEHEGRWALSAVAGNLRGPGGERRRRGAGR